jgi:hypothetical protein
MKPSMHLLVASAIAILSSRCTPIDHTALALRQVIAPEQNANQKAAPKAELPKTESKKAGKDEDKPIHKVG